MKKEILEQLSWKDLEEITETDDSLCFEVKLHSEWPKFASTPELYYKELLKRLKEKAE